MLGALVGVGMLNGLTVRADISPASRWNLNAQQGLRSAFEHRGWAFLVQQQEAHRATGQPLKALDWQPYVEVGRLRNQPVLRYFSADLASAQACVTCHNAWEQKPDIQQRRRQAGVEVGKVFERQELLGAVSITVPLQ